jgi:sulfate/thiosulfate transport system ATP-binding protein
MSILIKDLVKTFDGFAALKGVTLETADSEFIAFLGPSGSGKTTLLRCLAGLELPDAGRITFAAEDVSAKSPRDRNIGFVFQHYALFRHMSVRENIAFGLKVKPRRVRPSAKEIRARVDELLALVQLEGLAHRFPNQLSGGQRQRIALARALATRPRVLLLDEPFGALDARVRRDLRRWLRRLHEELKLTSIFVTHDQEEALELSDRVAVMHQGRIEQIGTPDEIYHRPATPFVSGFIGGSNQLPGEIKHGALYCLGKLIGPAPGGYPDGPAEIHVRQHEMELVAARNGADALSATVNQVFGAGPFVRIEMKVDGLAREIDIIVPHSMLAAHPQRGDTLRFRILNYSLFAAEHPLVPRSAAAPSNRGNVTRLRS